MFDLDLYINEQTRVHKELVFGQKTSAKPEGLKGVNRQPSNTVKFNQRPIETLIKVVTDTLPVACAGC